MEQALLILSAFICVICVHLRLSNITRDFTGVVILRALDVVHAVGRAVGPLLSILSIFDSQEVPLEILSDFFHRRPSKGAGSSLTGSHPESAKIGIGDRP